MTEGGLSARERELLDDMRKDIDRLKQAEPVDLFTRDDPTLIYANKGLLRENAQLRRDLDLKVKEVTEDGEEIVRLRGDVKVSREAYAHLLASHNELADLVIKEFGSSFTDEGAVEAAIRLLRGQKKRIVELEQQLTARSPEPKVTADSVVATLTDIASAVAAGIRKLDERTQK